MMDLSDYDEIYYLVKQKLGRSGVDAVPGACQETQGQSAGKSDRKLARQLVSRARELISC